MTTDPTLDLRQRARAFAIDAHAQQRYGKHPYSVHLDAVADIVRPFGALAEVIAFLHDVVEDTDITVEQIQSVFGGLVANCVSIVSDEPGPERAARKQATYKKMSCVQGAHQLALIVKAGDRLANTRACLENQNTRLLAVYMNEYKAFKAAAFRPGLCDSLWQELDALQVSGSTR